jgi:alpha-ketoglutarate-dependent taurine dioxygenase
VTPPISPQSAEPRTALHGGADVVDPLTADGLRAGLAASGERLWWGRDIVLGTAPYWQTLDPAQRAELCRVGEYMTSEQVEHAGAENLRALLPRVWQAAAGWSEQLERGCGWLVLRGFPSDQLSGAALERAFMALGKCLGSPVSQTHAANAIGEVADKGRSAQDPTVRGHQTCAELPFHCDRCDVIGLLCVRGAAAGGRSLLASAPAVLHTLLAQHPQLAQRLCRPLPHDRRGEELAGEAPWFAMEVFSFVDGRFVSRYIRRFVDSASRFGPQAALDAAGRRALDVVDALLAEPGRAVEMDLRPGDLQLVNNYTVWHARTAYDDSRAGGPGRLLLRLWLSSPTGRALPPSYRPLYGAVQAGVLRGGVPPGREGRLR